MFQGLGFCHILGAALPVYGLRLLPKHRDKSAESRMDEGKGNGVHSDLQKTSNGSSKHQDTSKGGRACHRVQLSRFHT